jgi:hypothetical protein
MNRYAAALAFFVACGGGEEYPPAPVIVNGFYEAESLCQGYERATHEAFRRCAIPGPYYDMECFRYSGVTTVSSAEMDRCVDDLDYSSCASLEDDQWVPSSCQEIASELQRNME